MRIKELEKQIEDKRIDDGGWNSNLQNKLT